MKRVLIICTGNSCRSQMAEGLWNKLGGGMWDASSAGSRPAGYVHPFAVKVMDEIGIDISESRSKHHDEFSGEQFDLVITVCDGAKESCPAMPGAKETQHWPFKDPANTSGTDEHVLRVFRNVRDRVAERIRQHLSV